MKKLIKNKVKDDFSNKKEMKGGFLGLLSSDSNISSNERLFECKKVISETPEIFVTGLIISLFKDTFTSSLNITDYYENINDYLNLSLDININIEDTIYLLDKYKNKYLELIKDDNYFKTLNLQIEKFNLKDRVNPLYDINSDNTDLDNIKTIIQQVQNKINKLLEALQKERDDLIKETEEENKDEDTKTIKANDIKDKLEDMEDTDYLVNFNGNNNLIYVASLLIVFIELKQNIEKTDYLFNLYLYFNFNESLLENMYLNTTSIKYDNNSINNIKNQITQFMSTLPNKFINEDIINFCLDNFINVSTCINLDDINVKNIVKINKDIDDIYKNLKQKMKTIKKNVNMTTFTSIFKEFDDIFNKYHKIQTEYNMNLDTSDNTNISETSNTNISEASNTNSSETSNTNISEASNTNISEASNTNISQAPNTNSSEASNINGSGASNINSSGASNINSSGASNINSKEKDTQLGNYTYIYINDSGASNTNSSQASNINVSGASNINGSGASNTNSSESLAERSTKSEIKAATQPLVTEQLNTSNQKNNELNITNQSIDSLIRDVDNEIKKQGLNFEKGKNIV